MSSMPVDKRIMLLVVVLMLFVFGGFAWLFARGGDEADVAGEGAEVFEFESEVRTAATVLGEGYERFTHPEYGFSVEYPDTLVITAYKEVEEGETIVFQKESGADVPVSERLGFQVFIVSFGQDEKITRERILEDVPFVTIDAPQEAILGTKASGEDVTALLFWSEDPRIGRTREVWFVRDGYLYEITAYAHLDEWLAKILSTLEFRI